MEDIKVSKPFSTFHYVVQLRVFELDVQVVLKNTFIEKQLIIYFKSI